jgi:WD40 repeat protein
MNKISLFLLCLLTIILLPKPSTYGQASEIVDIAWKPDSSQIAVSNSNGSIDIKLPTNDLVMNIPLPQIGARQIAWSSSGEFLAIGFTSSDVIVWNLQLNQQETTLQDMADGVGLISWNTDDSRIFAFGNDPSFIAWDVANNYTVIEIDQNRGGMQTSVIRHPTNPFTVVSLPTGGFYFVDPISFAEPTSFVAGSYTPENWIIALSWSPNGQWIATGTLLGNIKLWNASDLSPFSTLRFVSDDATTLDYPFTSIQAMTFSADNQYLYAVQGDGQLFVLKTSTSQLIRTIDLDSPIEIAEFSPNGQYLAYVNEAGDLEIHDTATLVAPVCQASPTTGPELLLAMANANANFDRDTICLDPTLTYALPCYVGEGALPQITTPIIIEGNGAAVTCTLGGPDLLQIGEGGSLELRNVNLVSAASPTPTFTFTPSPTNTPTATRTPTNTPRPTTDINFD